MQGIKGCLSVQREFFHHPLHFTTIGNKKLNKPCNCLDLLQSSISSVIEYLVHSFLEEKLKGDVVAVLKRDNLKLSKLQSGISILQNLMSGAQDVEWIASIEYRNLCSMRCCIIMNDSFVGRMKVRKITAYSFSILNRVIL